MSTQAAGSDLFSGLLRSAQVHEGNFLSTACFDTWFNERRDAHRLLIERIPFSKLEHWDFDHASGDLRHSSGHFFSIEGYEVGTNFGCVPSWRQPFINQPEVGILGILAKSFNGVLHFLMQAKMEPGNINMIQLSPTLQATHSNYTRVHQGTEPHYLHYFQHANGPDVIVDVLQSEQGARFLRKHNRNMVVMTSEPVEDLPDFQWFTLAQLQSLLSRHNTVNMDARTVLSCLPPPDGDADLHEIDAVLTNASRSFRSLVLHSLATKSGLHTYQQLLNWFTDQRVHFYVHARHVGLQNMAEWARDSHSIGHQSGRFFSVIACRIETTSREVRSWTQPLLASASRGLIAFIARPIRGVLHLLVQAKPEAGIVHQVELAPTVLCLPDHYKDAPETVWPPFLKEVLTAGPAQVRYDVGQSEEGGRFYREENRNLVIEVGDEFPIDLPPRFMWMTVRQLKEFVRHSHCVNIQARCLLAAIGAI